MQGSPPRELIGTIERLKLATGGQIRALGRRARRLARGLPMFDSVWVDSLVQSRLLTPFQAGEISAGRGESLRIGPYVLCRRVAWPSYVECYFARAVDSAEMARVTVVRPIQQSAEPLVSRFQDLVATSGSLSSPVLAPIVRVGVEDDRVWVASRHVPGRTAAEWMVSGGRFPPHVVLEIARQMLVGLTLLEQGGVRHSDLGPWGLILAEAGQVVLPQPGLRAVVRPTERNPTDLEPEAYDYLAPERIVEGSPPTVTSDIYACGCLWWHLLAGRAPLVGSSSAAKLDAVRTARVPDVSRLAPDTPRALAAAISACVEREPNRRPQSMAELQDMLGRPSRPGRRSLSRHFGQAVRAPRFVAPSARKQSRTRPMRPASIAGWLVAAAAILWAMWPPSVSDRPEIARANTLASTQDETVGTGRSTAEKGVSPLDGTLLIAARPPLLESPSPTLTPADRTGKSASQRQTDDLVLPSGSLLAIESLDVRPGQCVRGEVGSRPSVGVPYEGLIVACDGVRFENIDFVWDHRGAPPPSTDAQPAIVHVLASRTEFRGCSFQSKEAEHAKEAANGPGGGPAGPRNAVDPVPAAIRWTYPGEGSRADLAILSGRLQLSDCLLVRVSAGLSCETLGAPAVEMANVLYAGAGPLVRLDHCPEPDEPVVVGLSRVTLRNAGPLLECRYERIADQPGSISIRTGGCALATRPGAPLLSFLGPIPPERILNRVRWSGEGSLVLVDAIVAAWRKPDGSARVLDDSLATIAGVVRSRVEFAGPAETGPQASRVVNWQAPLRSSDPPGIDPTTIARPAE